MADVTPWQEPSADSAIATHEAKTQNVHGIADAAQLVTNAGLAAIKDQANGVAGIDANGQLRYGAIPVEPGVRDLQGRLMPVGDRRASWNGNALSDGVATMVTYKQKLAIRRAGRFIVMGFTNGQGANEGGAVTSKLTIVAAALSIDGGPRQPVYFGGSRSVDLNGKERVTNDPFDAAVTPASSVYLYLCIQVPAGQKWPLGRQSYTGDAEGHIYGANNVDAGNVPTTSIQMFAPTDVRIVPTDTTKPILALIGDSIAAGQGDADGNAGFMVDALAANDWGYAKVAQSGELARSWLAGHALRSQIIEGTTDAIVCLGTNDRGSGYSGAQIQAALQGIMDQLSARGLKVWLCTIPPRATSTDGFATVGNQTPIANDAARIAVNAWIRTTPSPAAGIFETADAVESARDSGVWKANYTADGTHPNGTGHTAMAGAINLAAIAGRNPATRRPRLYTPRKRSVVAIQDTILGGAAITLTDVVQAVFDHGSDFIFDYDVVVRQSFSMLLQMASNQSNTFCEYQFDNPSQFVSRIQFFTNSTAQDKSVCLTQSFLLSAYTAFRPKASVKRTAGVGTVTVYNGNTFTRMDTVFIPADSPSFD